MLQNYLITGFRSIRKHLGYSFINVAGLSLGIATCLILAVWIRHELSYDRFHDKASSIYRVSLEYSFGGQTSKTNVSPTALLPALEKNFGEVMTGVRWYNLSFHTPFIIRKGDQVFEEHQFYFADSTFFDVFSFPLLSGNPHHALVKPRSLVLTQSSARKYFDGEDPIGKVLRINNTDDYTVTGVVADPPSNTLLKFDFIASFTTLDASREQIWWSANYETFVVLSEQADIHSLEAKTNELVRKELASELTNSQDYVKYNFVKLTDIYLNSEVEEWVPVSYIGYVYGFGSIALIILAIACINYINLATARGADRAREVGIRKVAGAARSQLFGQFIGESLLVTVIAFIVAALVAFSVLPAFNTLTGAHLTTASFFEFGFLAWSMVALLGIAFLAGAYPAFALTNFKTIAVLKGNFKSSGKGLWLRQSLVVFQFCISIVLIVGTIVILKQLNFMQHTWLGYDKSNVIMLSIDNRTRELYGELRAELMRSGQIVQTARASESPTQIRGGYSIDVEGGNNNRGMIVTAMTADSTLVPTLAMEIIRGRNFTPADYNRNKADTTVAFILNESAVRDLLLDPDKAIGMKATLSGRRGEIVGIVKDFHFSSLHSPTGPLVLFNEDAQYHVLFIRLKPGAPTESIAAVRAVCQSLLPDRPFEFEFLDQKYGALYNSEERMASVGSIFSALAVFIACLGLFGLVAFAAAQKRKEIGVRKVMGASASQIVLLITRDYVKLVCVAIVIGIPLSWYAITTWFLSGFAYRTDIGLWPFVGAGVSSLAIAFGTASVQAMKAALVNPTETLRSE